MDVTVKYIYEFISKCDRVCLLDSESKLFFSKPIKDQYWAKYILISNDEYGIYISPTYKTSLDSEKYINAKLFRKINES